MQTQDTWKWGFFLAQHFRYAEESLPTDHRHVQECVRIRKRRLGNGELGEYEIVDESGGEWMGLHLWLPESEGAGPPGLQRFQSAWRNSWPSIAWTKDQSNRINRTEGDPVPTTPAGGRKPTFAFPIFNSDYDHDMRYAREQPSFPDPECYPRIAGGRIGIILDSAREDQQDPLWFDTDPRLHAVHAAGDPEIGSLVTDINADDEIDPTRCARLQTIFRVVKDPSSSCADFHGENTIAHDITETGRGDGHGGLWTDKPVSGATSGIPVPTGSPVQAAALNAAINNILPQGTVTAATRVHAFYSNMQGGPLIAGPTNDQHKFGVDADGNIINSGHLALRALKWFSVIEDGPDKYDGIFTYPDFPKPLPPVPAPFSTQVYYEFDPARVHTVCGVERAGEYRWRAAAFFYSPTNGRVPPPRPGPEDEGGVPPIGPDTPTVPAERPDPIPDPGPFDTTSTPTLDSFAGEVPPIIPRLDLFRNRPYAGSTLEIVAPALISRPQLFRSYVPDLRNWLHPTPNAVKTHDKFTPVTGRMEGYGGQGIRTSLFPAPPVDAHGPFIYTQLPGSSKYIGGTGPGGWVITSPEYGVEDYAAAQAIRSVEPPFAFSIDPFLPDRPASEVHMVFAPKTFTAWGEPDLDTGKMKLGYKMGADIEGNVGFDCVDINGAITRVATLRKDCAFEIEKLLIVGPVQWNVRTVFADTTALVTDFMILVDASGGSDVRVNLMPAAAVKGQLFVVKKIAGPGGKKAIIDPDGAELIDGNATENINILLDARFFISDGVEWWIIS